MEATLDIYDASGELICTVTPSQGSKRNFELMKEDSVTLKFTLAEAVRFPLGSWITCDFGRFEIAEQQPATWNTSTGGVDYELTFEAPYMKWRNKLFKYKPEESGGGDEAGWSITASLSTHMDIFLRNLEAWGWTEYTYAIADGVTAVMLFISYENANLIDALTQMAEAAGCEWWVAQERKEIHLGRLEDTATAPTAIKQGEQAQSVTLSRSSDNYFTRIIAFGGTQNISGRYRKKLEFTITDKKKHQTFLKLDKLLQPAYFRDELREKYTLEKTMSWDGTSSSGAPYRIYLFSSEEFYEPHDRGIYLTGEHSSGTIGTLVEMDLSKMQIYFTQTSGNMAYTSIEVALVQRSTHSEYEVFSNTYQINGSGMVTLGKFKFRYQYDTMPMLRIYPKIDSDAVATNSVLLIGEISFTSIPETVKTTMRRIDDGLSYEVRLNPWLENEMPDYEWDVGKGWYEFSIGDRVTVDGLVSTKVPLGYFQNATDGLDVNGIVQSRLMLPEGTPYIDIYEGMNTDEIIEGVVIFEDIYPGKTFAITKVDEPVMTEVMEEYADENGTTHERGTGIFVPTYTFYCDDLAGFGQECIIGDALTMTFQDGNLGGLSFGITWMEKKSTDTTAAFEIVANEDYGGRLPDITMRPEVGNKFVMAGYDTEFLFSDLTTEAEERLLEAAKKYKEKMLRNVGTATATMYSGWSAENTPEGELHPFHPGQLVILDEPSLIPTVTEMRVIGYSVNFDIPTDKPVYTVGESSAYSRLGALEAKIDGSNSAIRKYLGGSANNGTGSSTGGTSVQIVKTGDTTTQATDANVYSALRTDAEIDNGVSEAAAYTDAEIEKLLLRVLRKDMADETGYLVKFLAGLETGIYAEGSTGGRIGADGAAELLSLVLREGLKSYGFTTGTLGSGYYLGRDEDGASYLEVDKMLVRRTATFMEIIVQALQHVGGQVVLTPARMVCASVEATDGGWRCYFDKTDGERTIENQFAAGDMARCQTFNLEGGNRYYWRLVTAVGDDWIELSDTDCDTGSIAPQAGDEIVQLGNRTDAERQSAIILSAYGEGAPYIKMYRGIDSYALDGKEFFTAGRTEVDIKADRFEFTTSESVKSAVDGAVEQSNAYTDKAIAEVDKGMRYYLDLSGDTAAVACTADGTPTSGIPGTTATVYYGTDVDTGWSFELECAGCTGSVAADGTVSITSLTADTATAKVVATKAGENALEAVYTLAKAKAGTASYMRVTGEQMFVLDTNGAATPSAITLTATGYGTSGYQWSYKSADMDGFADIDGVTGSTYVLSPTGDMWGSGQRREVVTLRCTANGGEADEISVARVTQGAQGEPGENGSDGYTVLLTNESHTFIGTSEAAEPGEADCGIVAYKGAERVSATVGTISVPTGMTASVTGNGTAAAGVKFAVTGELSPLSGEVEIPVTVDGQAFTRTFSYSTALAGEAAVVYEIEPSADVVKVTADGETSPSALTCAVWRTTGDAARENATADAAVSLRYQRLGVDAAETAYTSAGVAIADGTTAVVFSLYGAADGKLWDRERVSVLSTADGMVIGGRNYLLNTLFLENTDKWTARTGVAIAADASNAFEGVNALKVTQTTAGSSSATSAYFVQTAQRTCSPCSFSFWAKADADTSIAVRLGSTACGTFSVGTEWTKVKVENKQPGSAVVALAATTACTWWLCKPMLEESTQAGDYAPNDEDLAGKAGLLIEGDMAEIYSTKAEYDALESRVTSAESSITVQGGTITSLSESVTTMGDKVTENSSKISQNSSQIASLVSENTDLYNKYSEIEQTTDTISMKVGAVWPENIFPDGDFRLGGLANVTATANTRYVKGADVLIGEVAGKSMYLYTYTGESYVEMAAGQIPVTGGRIYTLVFQAYCSNPFTTDGGSGFRFTKSDGTDEVIPFAVSYQSWQWHAVKVTAPDSAVEVAVRFGKTPATDADENITNQYANRACHVASIMLFEGDLSKEGVYPTYFVKYGKGDLLETGIDIANKRITVTSDQFVVRNNDGEVTASINSDGMLQVGSGEFSGLIIQKPYVVSSGTQADYQLSVGQASLALTKKNLVTGGFIVVTETDPAYLGNGITLPLGMQYAGAKVTIVNKGLTSLNIKAAQEELPAGYADWVADAPTSPFRLANRDCTMCSFENAPEYAHLELVAVPYMDNETDADGTQYYGMVRWHVLNGWLWGAETYQPSGLTGTYYCARVKEEYRS